MSDDLTTQNSDAVLELNRNEKTIGEKMLQISRSNPSIAAGTVVFMLMVFIAIFANILFTGDPNEPHVKDRLQAPSSNYWFGTDFVGRDVYTRTILGTRISLLVGVTVSLISVSLSVFIGLLTGYYRKVDAIVMRVMDGLMAIPSILLAMALMALLGGSVQNVIVALTVVAVPRTVRVVRASVLSLREQMFVDAARAVGARTSRILLIHILPNTIAPLIVLATFLCAESVLIEAALSFFGAGTPADIPSWGSIMADGRRYISQAMWVVVLPGIFLTLTVLAINLAGDGLRDILDPRLKNRL